MTCERFWREGVALAESGSPDPHRATCLDCSHAFKAHQELVHAVSLVGADHVGQAHWEARVWRAIDGEHKSHHVSRWWFGAGLLVAASAILLVWFAIRTPVDTEPRIEIVPGGVAMRTRAVHVGDRVRIAAGTTHEIRIYRSERLVLRCRDEAMHPDCTMDAHGLTASTILELPGDYQLLVITSGHAACIGSFDPDLATLRAADSEYQITELSVR